MIVTAESIVLRSRKQGDSSRIVTLYTREFGLLNVIAKGARQLKSPFGSSLQLFNHISAIFYKKENRSLYLLSKADVISQSTGIQRSLEQLTAASNVAEVILHSLQEEHKDEKLFLLVQRTLDEIAQQSPNKASLLVVRFYYRFASIEGFALQIPADDSSHARYILDPQSGEILATNASMELTGGHQYLPISPRAVFLLRTLDQPSIPVVTDVAVLDELQGLLRRYLKVHIETLRKVRS